MKFVRFLLASSLLVGRSMAQLVLPYEAGWENEVIDLSLYRTWGDPVPSVEAGGVDGSGFALSNNGDGNGESGLMALQPVRLQSGLTVMADFFVTEEIQNLWRMRWTTVTPNKVTEEGGGADFFGAGLTIYPLFSLWSVGGGDLSKNLGTVPSRQWVRLGFRFLPNGSVIYLRDEEVVHRTQADVVSYDEPTDLYLFFGGRSISGESLMDNLAIEVLGGADGDLLPDEWEEQEFGDLITSDGTGDFDGDELLDEEEWKAGTDPKKKDTDGDGVGDKLEVDAGSDPAVKESRPLDDALQLGRDLNLNFMARPTRLYALEISDDLSNWRRAARFGIVDGDGSPESWRFPSDEVEKSGQYFRLVDPSADSDVVLNLPLDGFVDDVSGHRQFVTSDRVEFGEDRFGNSNRAARLQSMSTFQQSKILVASDPSLQTSEFTVSVWIKATGRGFNSNQNWTSLIRKGIDTRYSLYTLVDSGGIRAQIFDRDPMGGRGSIISTEELPLDEWHHLVSTFATTNGGTLSLYKNGILIGTQSEVGPLPLNDEPISIGAGIFDGVVSIYLGWVDDLKIYNRTMTPEEVSALYSREVEGL